MPAKRSKKIIHEGLPEPQPPASVPPPAASQALPIFDFYVEGSTLRGYKFYKQTLGQHALEFRDRVLPAFRKAGEQKGVADTLLRLGFIYNELGEPQQALEFLKEASPIFKELGDWAGIAYTLGNIGQARLQLGEPQQALKFCNEEAMPIFKELGDQVGIIFALSIIRAAYNSLGEPQQALEAFNEARETYKRLSNQEIKLIEALNAPQPVALPPSVALLSDVPPKQGMEPETEHMDVDGQRLVGSFKRQPPKRQNMLLQLLNLPPEKMELALKAAFEAIRKAPPLPEPNGSYMTYHKFVKETGQTNGLALLKKEWSPWLKKWTKTLDRNYMSQADLRRLDTPLMRRLEQMFSPDKLAELIPTKEQLGDEEVALLTPDKVREVYRKNSLMHSRGIRKNFG